MAKLTLKGSTIHTSGNLPEKGSIAPDFTLVNAELEHTSLQDFDHRKKMLYFVPSFNTPVCGKTIRVYSEMAKEKPDVIFFVISADLPFAQKNFCTQESIANLVVLSTFRSKDFSQNYGIYIVDGPLEGLLARGFMVLDGENRVLLSEIVPEITDEPNFTSAFSLL